MVLSTEQNIPGCVIIVVCCRYYHILYNQYANHVDHMGVSYCVCIMLYNIYIYMLYLSNRWNLGRTKKYAYLPLLVCHVCKTTDFNQSCYCMMLPLLAACKTQLCHQAIDPMFHQTPTHPSLTATSSLVLASHLRLPRAPFPRHWRVN